MLLRAVQLFPAQRKSKCADIGHWTAERLVQKTQEFEVNGREKQYSSGDERGKHANTSLEKEKVNNVAFISQSTHPLGDCYVKDVKDTTAVSPIEK